MPSKIELQFNIVPSSGEYIDLKSSASLHETFTTVRTEEFQSTIVVGSVSATMQQYLTAFNADYSVGGSPFTLLITGSNTITIEHDNSGFFTTGNVDNGTAGSITVLGVTDTPDPITISIDSTVFSQATLPCNNVNISVTTSVLAVKYRINNGTYIANALNPFVTEQIRGQVINLEVENAEGATLSQNIQTPDLLVSANVSTELVNSPSGATITINVANPFGLSLEYSLDNTTWQTSNIYTAIVEGTYAVYVRDQFTCKVSIPLTVPAFEDGGVGERFPYSDLPSKSNSIRFEKYVDWGICSDYRNDENTLSCDLPYTQNNYEFFQLFQNCDTITTQIKNNYENNAATVIEVDGTETSIPVVKKSENTNRKDMREAVRYNLAGLGSQTGIYFTSGLLYDYSTGLPLAPPAALPYSYTLNGGLPAWGVVGNFVFVNGGWFEIVKIVYDTSKSAYVLVINESYVGVEETVIVSSVFNYEAYEIWEFVIDMNAFAGKKIQVNITQTDSDTSFPDVIYLSEIIDIAEVHEGTVLIEYYNNENTDIFYSTGIKNKIRLPIEYMGGGYSDSTETERTDINSYLINSEGYENDMIAFKLMPKQIMRKTFQALAHKFVFLNEVQYVKEESPEITHLIGTNQYRMNARMTKANAVYTSQGTGQVFNSGTFEVPSLLEAESGGFLEI